MRTTKSFYLYFFLWTFSLFLGSSNLNYAQLTTTSASGMTPQQLVQSVLLGSGVTVSNVKFNGSLLAPASSNQIGSFTTGSTPTNLGFSEGIIMSTGGIEGATNGQTTTTITGPQLTVVSELNQYTGSAGPSSIYDAAVLEFDFLPLSDTIKFRYAFGSREYPAFVCSSFNDVFGFFITGLNPNGANYVGTNIALIPNTNSPVSINTVNGGTSAGSTTPCILTNTQYYQTPIPNITYNGLTTVLTAKAVVVPCTPYHIKLAIADLGDRSYDSGVFLEANSFSSNSVSITTNYSSASATPMAIEGCNNAILKFTIPVVKTDTVFIPLIISGTAINGTDYQQIPNIIQIIPGQTSTTLTIIPIADGIVEPIETISIKVDDTTSCALLGDSTVIKILSRDPIHLVTSNDTLICQTFPIPTNTIPLNVQATGEAGTTFTYLWSPSTGLNSSIISNPISTPVTTTTYTVNVNDGTGCPGNSASILVVIGQTPIVNFTTSPQFPIIGCAPLNINFNDETYPVGSSRIWEFGDGNSSSDINITHSYLMPGLYSIKLTVITSGGCKSEFSQTDVITVLSQPNADFTWNPPIGTRQNPLISFVNLTTPNDTSFSWRWDFGDGGNDIAKNPSHSFPSKPEEKDYTVTLIAMSKSGCVDTVTYTNVKIIDDQLIIPNILTPNGDGYNDKLDIGALTKGGGYTETQIIIYNRWGKKVYENNNYKNDFAGEGLPDGAYYITIKTKGLLKDIEYNSSLQILR
ncbi:MAG: gliding motility-associated C-terminal domain-containing protein [Bacteroidetes bacterium]|nr:gliding motility-associated C-terminal domain-containing protein [Bacteroidota bacterium]